MSLSQRLHMRRRCLPKIKHKQSGFVLVIALWIISFLTLVSAALAKSAYTETSLAQYALSRLKAKQRAKSGIYLALNQIDKGRWRNNTVINNDAQYIRYTIEDEGGKLNLNALDSKNVSILVNLMVELGITLEKAQTIAYSILDWIDEDNIKSHEDFGAERDHYRAQQNPYNPKNRPFDSIEELHFVNAMTRETFQTLKPHVTIYPKYGKLKVNFDTASKEILTAITLFKMPVSKANNRDVERLVKNIIKYRNGPDAVEGTEDDRNIDSDFPDSTNALFLNIKPYQNKDSNFFSIQSNGFSDNQSIKSKISAVAAKDNFSILRWSE